jgi:hypothetical protein
LPMYPCHAAIVPLQRTPPRSSSGSHHAIAQHGFELISFSRWQAADTCLIFSDQLA